MSIEDSPELGKTPEFEDRLLGVLQEISDRLGEISDELRRPHLEAMIESANKPLICKNIEVLGLSGRPYNPIARLLGRDPYISFLLEQPPNRLLGLDNFGPKSFVEVYEKLVKFGVTPPTLWQETYKKLKK